ncbi:glycoside hydrolase family 23 protein [Sphaerobolus stellatus SS14]|nr:glycoside hydrolase family 23 protein [Sphaerobolus stellatus SS14]
MTIFKKIILFSFFFLSVCNAFEPWHRDTFTTLFQLHKRTAQKVRPKQCILVEPPPLFPLPSPNSGSDSDDDQSPLLPSPSESQSQSGTIRAQSVCGDIGATETITTTSGPNGDIGWLTCGINGTGWKPSYASVQDIITADLSSVLAKGNTPFEACNTYLDIINKYAAQYQVPPILVASFAMQESGCNPTAQGQGGEQGMMQISQDKCGGAPNGNCKDPDFNVHQGTKFLANTLSKNNGNILLTIGQYNGWYAGMTYQQATAAAQTSCCHCQQNLDYLFQMMNGWLLNRNPLTPPRLGVYFNVDVC